MWYTVYTEIYVSISFDYQVHSEIKYLFCSKAHEQIFKTNQQHICQLRKIKYETPSQQKFALTKQ